MLFGSRSTGHNSQANTVQHSVCAFKPYTPPMPAVVFVKLVFILPFLSMCVALPLVFLRPVSCFVLRDSDITQTRYSFISLNMISGYCPFSDRPPIRLPGDNVVQSLLSHFIGFFKHMLQCSMYSSNLP